MALQRIKVSIIILGILAILCVGCYSPIEGCLDPEASNYDLDGDNECLDCCKYPILKLSVFHLNQDLTFKLKDTISNDMGQKISLVNFVYLLSDFKLQTSEGEVYEVDDTIGLDFNQETLYAKDDVIRVRRGTFTYDIGTLILDGHLEKISFKVGLNDTLNNNRFKTSISGHPLTSDADTLYDAQTDSYVFQRMKVAQGFEFLDTVIYDIRGNAQVNIDLNLESYRGKNKTMIIEARYHKWFDGVDFETMDKEMIESLIEQNSKYIFQQKE